MIVKNSKIKTKKITNNNKIKIVSIKTILLISSKTLQNQVKKTKK